MKQNGILNLDLTQPIKSANEFRAVCAIIPMIDVEVIIDELRWKLSRYITWQKSEEEKGQETYYSAEYFEAMMHKAFNSDASGSLQTEITFQADAHSDLKTWSTSWLPAEDGKRNIYQAH